MKISYTILLFALLSALSPRAVTAQSIAYNSGQNVAPGYEGWEESADGTKYFLFGYMNRNWVEELDIPVGPENSFSPGGADRGQPTRFLPRRNIFVFRVKVPDGFTAKDELIWTLTSHGVTEKAYASLREDYKVDDVVKASETGALGAGASSPEVRSNKPPVVSVAQQNVATKVGQPLRLTAKVTDDGIPKRPSSGRPGSAVGAASEAATARVLNDQPRINPALLPPSGSTVHKNVGLHLTWFAYRAPSGAKVSFDSPQIKAWQDTRAGANSPWAPVWRPPTLAADGSVSVTVTFSMPGAYVLRAHADDGALLGYQEVTVTVTP